MDVAYGLALLLQPRAPVSFAVRLLIARAVSLWLIGLTIVAFTAPLSPCEMSELLSGTILDGLVPRKSAPHNASLGQAVLMHALPTVRDSARNKRQAPAVRLAAIPARSSGTSMANHRPNADNLLVPRPIAKTVLRI